MVIWSTPVLTPDDPFSVDPTVFIFTDLLGVGVVKKIGKIVRVFFFH